MVFTFFIRIWREFILTHKDYSFCDNFLPVNTHSCMELSAHSLHSKNQNTDENNFHFTLPTKEEIVKEIQFCQRAAIVNATKISLINEIK